MMMMMPFFKLVCQNNTKIVNFAFRTKFKRETDGQTEESH